MSKETLISIAQRTGFSVSTVSRVLSGQAAKYRISEKTVALIAREAERCNYTPSLLAKGLRTSRTDTLGLLIPSIDNPYFAHIASIIVHEARAKGYKVILIDTSEDGPICIFPVVATNILWKAKLPKRLKKKGSSTR